MAFLVVGIVVSLSYQVLLDGSLDVLVVDEEEKAGAALF